MDYVTIDTRKEIFYIPKAFFEKHMDEIVDIMPNFTFEKKEGEGRYVIVQGPKILDPKKEVEIVIRKEQKKEMTCAFCKDRIRCTTEDFEKCSGYKVNERFLIDVVKFTHFLKEKNMPILYAKVG